MPLPKHVANFLASKDHAGGSYHYDKLHLGSWPCTHVICGPPESQTCSIELALTHQGLLLCNEDLLVHCV